MRLQASLDPLPTRKCLQLLQDEYARQMVILQCGLAEGRSWAAEMQADFESGAAAKSMISSNPWLALGDLEVQRGSRRDPGAVQIALGQCYYNAMDCYIRTGATVAWGIVIEPEVTSMPNLHAAGGYITLHAFNLSNGRIIDNTLPDSAAYYKYAEVPTELADQWAKDHRPGDSNFDARAFGKYVQQQLERLQAEFYQVWLQQFQAGGTMGSED